jgi:hypothetical protein
LAAGEAVSCAEAINGSKPAKTKIAPRRAASRILPLVDSFRVFVPGIVRLALTTFIPSLLFLGSFTSLF